MKNLLRIIPILSLFLIVASPLIVHAAGETKNEIVMKMGSKVHLFHSSNVEAQKEIAIGDVRVSARSQQKKEVGQIKVLGFMGEHNFEAEIVKGKIKVGDIAIKGDTGLLVQPAK
jgi:hypothetical protein